MSRQASHSGAFSPNPSRFFFELGVIMHLCYMDESGTPDIPGNTSHFILVGLAIPIRYWKNFDNDIEVIKKKYHLEENEIHTAWIMRKYLEQDKITGFESMSRPERVDSVRKFRLTELLRLQRVKNNKLYKQVKKNYRETEGYIHLTLQERTNFIMEVAETVSQWGFARLFAECIDKTHFNPARTKLTVEEQAFEQVVSRFEQFLENTREDGDSNNYGLLIHDNNQTVARKHTAMMRKFHRTGTLWTRLQNIIETPLFVDSQLTSLVQVADLCAYAIRRYLENNNNELFERVFKRADRKSGIAVGIRHYTASSCKCKICAAHRLSQ